MSTMTLSGPMFEPSEHGHWWSIHKKNGAHYNTYTCRDDSGMAALREFFPNGTADAMNFVLFSTSGVHGTYTTIEDAEAAVGRGNKDEDGEEWTPSLTFLVVQPRIVCLRYGNCCPQSAEDFEFLKALRASSWQAALLIGSDALTAQQPEQE